MSEQGDKSIGIIIGAFVFGFIAGMATTEDLVRSLAAGFGAAVWTLLIIGITRGYLK